MPRKPRSDSITAAVKAAMAVMEPPPEPLKHTRLRERDTPFWDDIIRARTRDEWTNDQLVIAAQLARCQSDIEDQQQMLDDEGMVIEKETRYGMQPIPNPRVSVLEHLARRQIYLMRSMGMIMVAGNGTVKHAAQAARKLQRQAGDVKEELEDESLLA